MAYLIQTLPNFKIYLTWDRRSTKTALQYNVLYSEQFDGDYVLLDSVNHPTNEYIHEAGNPTYYYKIREMDITDPDNPIELETSQPFVGDEFIVLSSLMYQLNDLLSVPIHDEEIIFNNNRREGHTAFLNWNYYPKPEIRITSSSEDRSKDPFIILNEYDAAYSTIDTNPIPFSVDISLYDGIETTDAHGFSNNESVKFLGNNLPTDIDTDSTYYVIYNGSDSSQFQVSHAASGNIVNFTENGTGQVYAVGTTHNYPNGLKYKVDYQGKIYFIDNDNNPTRVQDYDIVYASYGVQLFTPHEINDAAQLALQNINMQPGSTKSNSVATAPAYYDPTIVAGAIYYLIRGLLLRLTQRETRLLVEDPEKYDVVSGLRDMLKEYSSEYTENLKIVGKTHYPGTVSIITPTYQLPGSRSRFFRGIWGHGV